MSIDYAHTRIAEQQRVAKAQTLARWCYSRGLLDDRILHTTPQLRRATARSAGVTPPHENNDTPGETWQIVVELLTRKLAWDRDHHVTSPRPARCLECAIRGDWCERHEPRNCTVCSGPLPWVFLEEGSTTHPSCDLDDDQAKRPGADQTPSRPETQQHSAVRWRFLEPLLAAYPEPLGKDELAEAADVSAKSSGFANNLGALRSLGLLDYPTPGYVVASPLLFLG